MERRRVIDWVVLTRGDRPIELDAALRSLATEAETRRITVIVNGGEEPVVAPESTAVPIVVERLATNIGIPAARNVGLRAATAELVGFLDDDATLAPGALASVVRHFAERPAVAVVAMRIVDPRGRSQRRHVPRIGAATAAESGRVVGFLGGACVVRRAPVVAAGGYWDELFYGHEEIELAWRLCDRGAEVYFDADAVVVHPDTGVGRHPDGWYRTGHNRVLIARRTLPLPVCVAHTVVWFLVGLGRARADRAAGAYARGWVDGWSRQVHRDPISWRSLVTLTRLGRPPIV